MKDNTMFGQKLYLEFRGRLTKELMKYDSCCDPENIRKAVDIVYEEMKEEIHDEIPVSTSTRHINT